MPEQEVTLANEVGLHARPAAVFSKAASRFAADVTIAKGDQEANAKSIMAVLKLDVRRGDRVRLAAEGEDAGEAVAELIELVRSL
jgi:phosphotransferase system HPr (HPr) family protein